MFVTCSLRCFIISLYSVYQEKSRRVLLAGVYEHIRNTLSHSKHVPYFEVSTERNVSVVVGQTSHLNCTVRDLGDRTVSTQL